MTLALTIFVAGCLATGQAAQPVVRSTPTPLPATASSSGSASASMVNESPPADEDAWSHEAQDARDRAQEESEQALLPSNWGIGASVGSTTGMGLSVRKHFASGFGFNLSAGGLAGRDFGLVSVGGEVLYTFKRYRRVRFYGFVGAALYGFKNRQSAYAASDSVDASDQDELPADPEILNDVSLLDDGDQPRQDEWSTTLLAGPGGGVEFHFGQHVGWALEIPISVWTTLSGPNRLPLGGSVNVLPTPSTTLVFYF